VRLSDADILAFRRLGQLDITPWGDDSLQSASYDLHLGCYVQIPDYWILGPDGEPVVVWRREKFEEADDGNLRFTLHPNAFVLLSTVETVRVAPTLASAVAGKSSKARDGIAVEFAGWVDPGFEGQLTLEVKNNLPFPIRLTAGMPICQVIFEELRTKALRPYGERGHYQGQRGPTTSWAS
jgi:dCTP deaminase